MPHYLTIYISIGSLVVAWIAALIAYRSHVIAKRSLLIAEEQALGRRPSLIPYLADGFASDEENTGKKIYAFSISLTNRSDSDNAITEIELFLTYYRPSQPIASLLLPHNSQLRTPLDIRQENVLTTPLKVSAHQTVAGWVIFECDHTIIDDVIIDSYEIRVTDSNGIYSKLQPIIIKELINEKETS